MRLVVSPEPGIVELTYTWLPTWISMNTALKKKLEDSLQVKVVGLPMTDETLDMLHEEILDFFVKEFPQIVGFRDYLDGVKFINFQ